MNYRLALGVPLALALLVSALPAEESLKSGPQVGTGKITPFHPLHVTGSGAGGKACLV